MSYFIEIISQEIETFEIKRLQLKKDKRQTATKPN